MTETYGVFVLKVITILLALIIFFAAFFIMKSKARGIRHRGRLVISNLSEKFFNTKIQMIKDVGQKKEIKNLLKELKNKSKKRDKIAERVFILKFKGDIKAGAVTALKEEVSAVLSVVDKKDRVAVILESPGGMVSNYGLAASELDRFRKKGIHLTVLIDKVAASGGYMVACVANEVIAAPFAVIGSIGVIAQVPNFNRLLESKGIDFEQITSGKYKRTITMFGKNTDQDRKKMQSDLNDIHISFKDFIKERRPSVDIEKISTGEFWLASKAKELNLVDELMTSSDYLMQLYLAEKTVLLVEFKQEETFATKISNAFVGIKNSVGLSHYL